MTLEEINAVLRPLGEALEFEKPLALDDSGIAQLTYADDDGDPIEIDLERDGETGRLMLYLDAGNIASSENREAVLTTLLQQNLRWLSPSGISIGLSPNGEHAVMSRVIHDTDLNNGELAVRFEEFVAAGVEIRDQLGGNATTEDESEAADNTPGDEHMVRI